MSYVRTQLLLFTSTLGVFVPTLAWDQLKKVGGEFTFTTEDRLASDQTETKQAALHALWQAIRGRCPSCTLSPRSEINSSESFRVTLPNGWWFRVATDSSVIEVQTMPGNSQAIESEYQDDLQKVLFDSAAKVGLKPHRRIGGGHIHLDASSFPENGILFRNFLVGLANHPELGAGILGPISPEQAPLIAASRVRRVAFTELIEDFDAGRVRISGKSRRDALAIELERRVYWIGITDPHERDYVGKHQFVTVERMAHPERFPPGESTVQLRISRPQQTAAEFSLEAKLFDGWFRHLENLSLKGTRIRFLDPPLSTDPDFMLSQFKRFARDAGMSWDLASKLVSPEITMTNCISRVLISQ